MTTTQTHHQEGERACCGPACCGGTAPAAAALPPVQADAVRTQVREGYGQIARTGVWNSATSPATTGPGCGCAPARAGGSDVVSAGGGGCCGPTTFSPDALAQAIGYAQSDLKSVPETANLGLSCGNPTAIAALRPGEVVLDLGAGGGFDCFIAGARVGSSGRVIGVDMTPDMVSRARAGVPSYTAQTGLNNVEFRLGEIEHLPVADASVDVVISNCVLNLSPDKPRVWREIARVLRPGGRVAVSDLALLRPLPEAVKRDAEALVGCIAGAALVDEVRAMAEAAGLVEVAPTPKRGYIEAMMDTGDPLYRKIVASLAPGTTPGDYITSLDITARVGVRA